MSSIIRWRRSRRAGMDSGLFMGRLLLLERSQNAQCSPGAAQPGCYVSALTASSHAPLPRSGFVLRPGTDVCLHGLWIVLLLHQRPASAEIRTDWRLNRPACEEQLASFVRPGRGRVESDIALEQRHGVAVPVELDVEGGKVVERIGIVRLNEDGAFEMSDCLAIVTRTHSEVTKVKIRLREGRLGVDRGEVMRLRLGGAPEITNHVADIEANDRVARAGAEAGIVEALRRREIAGAGCVLRLLDEGVGVRRGVHPGEAHLPVELGQHLADAHHQIAGPRDVEARQLLRVAAAPAAPQFGGGGEDRLDRDAAAQKLGDVLRDLDVTEAEAVIHGCQNVEEREEANLVVRESGETQEPVLVDVLSADFWRQPKRPQKRLFAHATRGVD